LAPGAFVRRSLFESNPVRAIDSMVPKSPRLVFFISPQRRTKETTRGTVLLERSNGSIAEMYLFQKRRPKKVVRWRDAREAR